MLRSDTVIPASHAAGYLRQLCMHFGHKISSRSTAGRVDTARRLKQRMSATVEGAAHLQVRAAGLWQFMDMEAEQ